MKNFLGKTDYILACYIVLLIVAVIIAISELF